MDPSLSNPDAVAFRQVSRDKSVFEFSRAYFCFRDPAEPSETIWRQNYLLLFRPVAWRHLTSVVIQTAAGADVGLNLVWILLGSPPASV